MRPRWLPCSTRPARWEAPRGVLLCTWDHTCGIGRRVVSACFFGERQHQLAGASACTPTRHTHVYLVTVNLPVHMGQKSMEPGAVCLREGLLAAIVGGVGCCCCWGWGWSTSFLDLFVAGIGSSSLSSSSSKFIEECTLRRSDGRAAPSVGLFEVLGPAPAGPKGEGGWRTAEDDDDDDSACCLCCSASCRLLRPKGLGSLASSSWRRR